MKIELKSIKVSQFASQETHCYEAKLYVDGKAVAVVSNDGRGGCDYEDWMENDSETKASKRVHAYFSAMPEEKVIYGDGENDSFMSQPTLEYWCCDQVNIFLAKKELKKLLKKGILMVDDDGMGVIEIKDKAKLAHLLSKASEKFPEAIVLNNLTFDAALELFRKH